MASTRRPASSPSRRGLRSTTSQATRPAATYTAYAAPGSGSTYLKKNRRDSRSWTATTTVSAAPGRPLVRARRAGGLTPGTSHHPLARFPPRPDGLGILRRVRRELLTRWGRDLDPGQVLPEYPRPQLVRDSHLNLNGWWDYAITHAAAPAPEAYDGRILVPFSPEAPLSGVGRQLLPDHGRLLLHFGAVDQTCGVRVDGVEVGANEGGYLPFTCDGTDALRSGRGELVV